MQLRAPAIAIADSDRPKINCRRQANPGISSGVLPHTMHISTVPRPIPLWLKIAFTVFMAVLLPVYWYHYGPTNFLYFCDVALILTLIAIWTESALLISMCCVGILLPQALWLSLIHI